MPTTQRLSSDPSMWHVVGPGGEFDGEGAHWERLANEDANGLLSSELEGPYIGSYVYAQSRAGTGVTSGQRSRDSAALGLDLAAIRAAFPRSTLAVYVVLYGVTVTMTGPPEWNTTYNTRAASGSVRYSTTAPGDMGELVGPGWYVPEALHGAGWRPLRAVPSPAGGSQLWTGGVHSIPADHTIQVPTQGVDYLTMWPIVDPVAIPVGGVPAYVENSLTAVVHVDVTTYDEEETIPPEYGGETGTDPDDAPDDFDPDAPADSNPECRTLLALVQEFSHAVRRAVRITGPTTIVMVDPNEPLPDGWYLEDGARLFSAADHALQAGDDVGVSYAADDLEMTAGATLVRDDVRLLVSGWQIPGRVPVYELGAAAVKRITHTFTPEAYSAAVELHMPSVPAAARRP